MKQSIYQISQDLEQVFNTIEANNGEVTEEIEKALSITQEQLNQKGVQYAFKCLDIDALNNQIDAEIERLNKIKKANNNLKERLKYILSNTMLHFGIEKLETPTLKVSFRKSESIEITDESQISKEFITEKITRTPNKTAIKEALKKGKVILGVEIKINQNLQIK